MPDVPNVLNHALDDPRLLLSEPFRAVHFVFGLFYPELRPLPGRALLGSLQALGFGEPAGRGIVLRLRRRGFLVSERHGREAAYALGPDSDRLLGEISRRATGPTAAWDGAFDLLLVRLPNTARAFREQLRRHAAYAGLGSPAPGLLVAADPDDVAAIQPLLARAPDGTQVVRGRLLTTRADGRRLAADAWALDPVAARLRTEARRMDAVAEGLAVDVPEGEAALAQLWQAIGPFFEILSEGRPLPPELLPDDWPLPEAHAAFLRIAAVLGPRARTHLEDLARA
jgi:phenylacetic acid degradation operon negative regulatory protein